MNLIFPYVTCSQLRVIKVRSAHDWAPGTNIMMITLPWLFGRFVEADHLIILGGFYCGYLLKSHVVKKEGNLPKLSTHPFQALREKEAAFPFGSSPGLRMTGSPCGSSEHLSGS